MEESNLEELYEKVDFSILYSIIFPHAYFYSAQRGRGVSFLQWHQHVSLGNQLRLGQAEGEGNNNLFK